MRFSGIDCETRQETHCAIKWNFFPRFMPGFLRSPHKCRKEWEGILQRTCKRFKILEYCRKIHKNILNKYFIKEIIFKKPIEKIEKTNSKILKKLW